tara:strand:+ start:303 stop:971 length:669 start_codon:yes stop_codon:yes gene_type:complete
MISYNDLIQISFLHTNKMYDELLQYVQNKINEKGLIKFLNKVKSLKYITETDSINLNYKDRELIIYKENFLKNLPTDSISTHIVDGHNVTIGYPDMDNYNTGSFLKEIDGEKITEKDYKHIPLSFIRKIKKHTSPFIQKLNDTYVYYINENYNSRFIYNQQIIINIIYFAFVYSYEALLRDQVFLIKNFNFTRVDFNDITYNQYKDYVKVMNKMTKDERASQ